MVSCHLTKLDYWVLQAVQSIILNGFDTRESLSASQHIWFASNAIYSEYYAVKSASREAGALRTRMQCSLLHAGKDAGCSDSYIRIVSAQPSHRSTLGCCLLVSILVQYSHYKSCRPACLRVATQSPSTADQIARGDVICSQASPPQIAARAAGAARDAALPCCSWQGRSRPTGEPWHRHQCVDARCFF